MTLDEAIKYEEEMVEIGEIYEVSTGVEGHRQLLEWLKDYKRLLEQEPCEDAISRQVAIDTIESWLSCKGYNEAERHIMRAMRNVLYEMPSVTPKPKTGRWKQISPARIYECDICGQNVMTDDISAYRYCHGCGAKMMKETEESEG